MPNLRSVQRASNPEGARSSPETAYPQSESLAGVSGSTQGRDGEQLDPTGVLQAAAQWAATITGADGAAIAVGSASGMRCCASFGNAPVVSSPVSSTSGLSGICLQTSKLVQCDDTEMDTRVDAVACRKLDLRSVLVVPVLVDRSLRAMIEVFSSKPHAFDARHQQDLARVSDSLAALLAHPSSEPSISAVNLTAEENAPSTTVEGATKVANIPAFTIRHSFPSTVAAESGTATAPAEVRTGASAMAGSAEPLAPSSVTWRSLSPASKAAIVCAGLVFLLAVAGYLVSRHPTSSPVAVTAGAPTSLERSAQASTGAEITFDQTDLSVTAPVEARPAQGAEQRSQIIPGKLIRTVEPTYPTSARDSGIGGAVVLSAIVSRTGAVESVKFVRGPEPLAEAAMDAVRQWVYEPYRRKGEPIAVQTTIIVKFTPIKR